MYVRHICSHSHIAAVAMAPKLSHSYEEITRKTYSNRNYFNIAHCTRVVCTVHFANSMYNVHTQDGTLPLSEVPWHMKLFSRSRWTAIKHYMIIIVIIIICELCARSTMWKLWLTNCTRAERSISGAANSLVRCQTTEKIFRAYASGPMVWVARRASICTIFLNEWKRKWKRLSSFHSGKIYSTLHTRTQQDVRVRQT